MISQGLLEHAQACTKKVPNSKLAFALGRINLSTQRPAGDFN